MNNSHAEDLSSLTIDCQNLIASQQTLLLSTATANAVPEISYAPYIRDHDGCFYVFTSELTRHTANLLENPQASILFIQAESESRNLFARQRTVFHCRVREVFREDPQFNQKLQALQEKFGEVVQVLRALSDFHLFSLQPESGRYVVGFGRAYEINVANGALNHIKPGANNMNGDDKLK